MTSLNWYKGSLHNHTNRSDGDSEPETVADWYRRNGYDFIVFTDHNVITDLPAANTDSFLVIPGEEVTLRINEEATAIHLNALGITETVMPVQGRDVVSTLQANVDAIVRAEGIAVINHPNYTWAFDHRHLVQVTGALLLEIQNLHPVVNSYGGAGRPSCEEIWAHLLDAGQRIFGIATDDSHKFQGDFTPREGNPGRGWVMVRAARLDQAAVLSALRRGDFYASTGVVIEDMAADQNKVRLHVKQDRDFVYTVRFIGKGQRVLKESYETLAEYHPAIEDGYVRAVVECSSGAKAWTQPTFLT